MRRRVRYVTVLWCLLLAGCQADGLSSVDLMIAGGTVITMDDTRRLITDGAVVVDDGEIVAVEDRSLAESRYRADDLLDATGQIVLPGLSNTHTHALMVLLRGLADDVSATVVDGAVLMRGGVVQSVDADAILLEARQWADRVRAAVADAAAR